ncbi:MAG TPA: putative baseplate assembly protein [Gemmatimonadaceae bacterium]|jgi:hypothetical protein
MSAPTPDLKAHVPPAPDGSACCSCCEGTEVETPRQVTNRQGLSAINYRVGEYTQFKDSMLALLSSSQYPQLSQLRTRDGDDFTIALIDAFACVADVLTFYQERIANESYLRTAVERVSLQELGKLIGYRLRPGVAAETWLALALETPPTPPKTLGKDPGNFVTGVPKSRALDSGLKVQSIPGPNGKPQIFETLEALGEARPEWNAMLPWLSEIRAPVLKDTHIYLTGIRNSLKSGDALVIVGGEFLANNNNDNWDFRVVDSVTLDPDNDRTLVTWKRGLGSIDPPKGPTSLSPQVHVFRKRAAVFGHNAPLWKTMPEDFKTAYAGKGNVGDDWPDFNLSPRGATADGGHVDLDGIYSDAPNASYVVLARGGFNNATEPAPSGTYVELYDVANVAEVSRAAFAMSAKVTRLRLTGENYLKFQPAPPGSYVRETTAFVASDQLAIAEHPVTTAISGARIQVKVAADGLIAGRRLIIRGTSVKSQSTVTVQATLVAAHVIDASRCELEIAPPISDPLVRESAVVYGNVVSSSHGESVSQLLGAGNASTSFQRFELKQQPLTYRAAPNEIGVAAELTVRVGEIAWTERPTMYGAGPTDRAYTINTDEQGRTFVVFGDGINGARLPTGVLNVRAAYRKGLGIDGNVDAEKLTQLVAPPIGVKSVTNPMPAEGGAEPEPATDARASMPLVTRTLGRAVSVLDYEDFARAYSGIAKAQARVLSLGSGRVVAITIAGPEGSVITAVSPTWKNLLDALRTSGDPHVGVALLSHQPSTFRLGLKVKRDPAYEIKTVLDNVEATLRARYGFDSRALTQAVQQSEVISIAQSVPGVVAVDVTRLYGGTRPTAQTIPGALQVRLLASQMRVEGGVAKPAELITLDAAPFDQLEEMT